MEMKMELVPVLDIYDFEKVLVNKYGEPFYDLAWTLFDDNKIDNDTHLIFHFDKNEEVNKYDQNEAIKRNIVREFLRETYPNCKSVIVHIYW